MKDENQAAMGEVWAKGIIVRKKIKCKGQEMGQGSVCWRNRKKGQCNSSVGSKGDRSLERKAGASQLLMSLDFSLQTNEKLGRVFFFFF